LCFGATLNMGAIIKEFYPQVEIRSFLSIGLLPLFTCDFVASDFNMQCPIKIFAILKKDKGVEKNLNLICSQVIWSEINKENKIWVVEQLQAMEVYNGSLEFSFIKNISKGNKLLIHMGTGSSAKLLPDEFWLFLISNLKSRFEITLLFGPAEKSVAFQDQNDFAYLKNVPLRELIPKMKEFQFYLGLDSGISHLAGVMGLKGFAFFHSTDPTYWRPMGGVKPFTVQKTDKENWIQALEQITKLLS
jgi:hypothetical protein